MEINKYCEFLFWNHCTGETLFSHLSVFLLLHSYAVWSGIFASCSWLIFSFLGQKCKLNCFSFLNVFSGVLVIGSEIKYAMYDNICWNLSKINESRTFSLIDLYLSGGNLQSCENNLLPKYPSFVVILHFECEYNFVMQLFMGRNSYEIIAHNVLTKLGSKTWVNSSCTIWHIFHFLVWKVKSPMTIIWTILLALHT